MISVAKISLQFHVTPEELWSLVRTAVSDFGLHVVAMKFFPFAAREVGSDGLEDVFAEGSPYSEVNLTIDKPVMPVADQLDFFDKNPDALTVKIKRVDKEGLRQSHLSATTDNAKSLAVWKQFAKRLKGMTKAGVTAINPDTGASVQVSSFRYSEGAKALASSGVPMLPIAGGNRIEFTTLASKTKPQ